MRAKRAGGTGRTHDAARAAYPYGMTPTIEFIRQHRSIRQFTDAPVPEEDIIRAVEAGQAASTRIWAGVRRLITFRARAMSSRGNGSA